MTEHGAFVELAEGIEGFLHVQDLSWTRRYNHPFECLKKGQEIEAVILSAEPENQKISLSLKALTPDPWPSIIERYPPGTLVEGKVVKVASFGIFIEIEKDLDGLAHLSELPVRLPATVKRAGGRRGKKGEESGESDQQPPAEAIVSFLEGHYKVGEVVQARVLRVDEEQRRIALSLKRV
jgi:small subunit ribosomal protein S1